MQTPLRITFHQLPSSAALEARVQKSVDELESLFDRIVSCHVTIEAPQEHRHKGGLYRVRIEIGVPGARIVVGRSPDEDDAHADAYVALHDAFRAARRRLDDHAKQLNDMKAHASRAAGR
jgi:ribosome-associated translation inhibitor RaiA